MPGQAAEPGDAAGEAGQPGESGAAGATSSPEDAGSAGAADVGAITGSAGELGAAGSADGGSAGAPGTSEGGAAGADGGASGAAPTLGGQWAHCDVMIGDNAPGDACAAPLLCGQYIVHAGDSGANHICTFSCHGADAGESVELAAKCKAIGGVCYSASGGGAMCVPSEPS